MTENKVSDAIAALLGGSVVVDRNAVAKILEKTKIARSLNASAALLTAGLIEVKLDLLFLNHRRSQPRALISAIKAAAKLKSLCLSGKIAVLDGEPADYTASLVEQLDFFLILAERDIRAGEHRAEVLREIISGPVAQAFVAVFDRAPGVSMLDDQPTGPFVRFVRAIFDEFAPELTPISGHTIRQAAEEWKRNASRSKLK